MQTVILAAGRGTRMGELTKDVPKPMLKVAGKNLIEHKLDMLPASVKEAVLVVGYLGDAITGYFGSRYKGRDIRYVRAEKMAGTGYALWQAKPILGEKFIVMMGDDIYCEEDIERVAKEDWAMLVKHTKTWKSGGKVTEKEGGYLDDVAEGKAKGDYEEALVNTGLYVMRKDIFNYDLVKLPGKEEWGLPQTLAKAAKDFPVKLVRAKEWLQISDPNDLMQAELAFRGVKEESVIVN